MEMSYVHNKNAKFINFINPHSLNMGKNLDSCIPTMSLPFDGDQH